MTCGAYRTDHRIAERPSIPRIIYKVGMWRGVCRWTLPSRGFEAVIGSTECHPNGHGGEHGAEGPVDPLRSLLFAKLFGQSVACRRPCKEGEKVVQREDRGDNEDQLPIGGALRVSNEL